MCLKNLIPNYYKNLSGRPCSGALILAPAKRLQATSEVGLKLTSISLLGVMVPF